MEDRRQTLRQSVRWLGNCHLEGESLNEWPSCRVVDISILGLGVMFRHRRPSELVGRCLSVEVPAPTDSLTIRLEGQIKNATTISSGTVRVGVEFVGLTEEERAIATVLDALTEADPTPNAQRVQNVR